MVEGVDKKAGVEVKTAWGQEQMLLYCRVRYREFSVLSPHLRLVRLGYLSRAMAPDDQHLRASGCRSLKSGSHAQIDCWWSGLKWGQRLQSELEFVLAPDQTVPLSVAPVSLYKGLRRKRTVGGGGAKERRKHTQGVAGTNPPIPPERNP